MDQELPTPDANAQAHSNRLLGELVKAAATEPLRFSDYMQRCLYEPGLGYYLGGMQKFGQGGDFITAPEVSPLFGACLAEQCAQVLHHTGGGLLELGAGSGRLAISIIEEFDRLGTDWQGYTILEPSAELQARQRANLKTQLSEQHLAKVNWVSALPEAFTGVVLANEVMDALPVERIKATTDGFSVECVVATNEPGEPLALDDQPAQAWGSTAAWGEPLNLHFEHVQRDCRQSFAPGYTTELHTLLGPWVKSVADCLAQGVLLLVDYGYPRREYYHPERSDGTLQCFYQHRAHNDVLFWPGLQDITAHVDFTTVIEAADEAGLELMGYSTQAAFLFACGLAEKSAQQPGVWGSVDTESAAGRIQQQQAVNRLSLPGEMGERFQVMGLGRGMPSALKGFLLQDLSHRL